jgi:spore coat polysaccharide biosynthesis predicted glycosyltransferase SpsG/CMP-N-acetylneuraminic acid synthetase
MEDCLIVIPAVKKNAVIPDQLIKKINGITLIQRAIDTARELVDDHSIYVLTDSEELSVICQRNSIHYYYHKDLQINSNNIIQIVLDKTQDFAEDRVLLYRANTPLVDSSLLKEAYTFSLLNNDGIVISVKQENKELLKASTEGLVKIDQNNAIYYEELKAFQLFSKSSVLEKRDTLIPFCIDDEKSIEIDSYQDWWVCEKILSRKKIVFHVIGSIEIGMGHIYHSLALAHEITDHEVVFVCDEQYKVAVDKIALTDYKVISSKNTLETILSLKPDLVINDILNTKELYVSQLIKDNIKVVNFEDLGSGSKYANLVFNELYDEPKIAGENYLWGYKYLALRDEFNDAKRHSFEDAISGVLITFGGTDQNNLTMLALESIINDVINLNIEVHIVCGAGYLFKKDLQSYLDKLDYKKIYLEFASGAISQIMQKCEIAISSNGRTVYELADMNIPSIIISHHERESTHEFASLEKGFLNLGVYNKTTLEKLENGFHKLVTDIDYRKLLYLNINKYNFRDNKQTVVKKIMALL